MQVANDVASVNELPSCEARPGRRVNNSASGKLQGGELRKDCWSVVLLAESAAFVAYEASSDVSALPPWSAVMLAQAGAVLRAETGGAPGSESYRRSTRCCGVVRGAGAGVPGQRLAGLAHEIFLKLLKAKRKCPARRRGRRPWPRRTASARCAARRYV